MTDVQATEDAIEAADVLTDETPEPEQSESGQSEPEQSEPRGLRGAALLEKEGDVAADYLEGLLDIADLDGDIDIDVEGNRAMVSIVEVSRGDLQHLVGDDGKVLDALQELTRLAATRETGERSRLMLDIAGHRAARRAELVTIATAAIEEAQRTSAPVRLEPMSPFERKVVHDAVADAGLRSESEGDEPRRFVVITVA
jgi:spoIIIJ-associated protein